MSLNPDELKKFCAEDQELRRMLQKKEHLEKDRAMAIEILDGMEIECEGRVSVDCLGKSEIGGKALTPDRCRGDERVALMRRVFARDTAEKRDKSVCRHCSQFLYRECGIQTIPLSLVYERVVNTTPSKIKEIEEETEKRLSFMKRAVETKAEREKALESFVDRRRKPLKKNELPPEVQGDRVVATAPPRVTKAGKGKAKKKGANGADPKQGAELTESASATV